MTGLGWRRMIKRRRRTRRMKRRWTKTKTTTQETQLLRGFPDQNGVCAGMYPQHHRLQDRLVQEGGCMWHGWCMLPSSLCLWCCILAIVYWLIRAFEVEGFGSGRRCLELFCCLFCVLVEFYVMCMHHRYGHRQIDRYTHTQYINPHSQRRGLLIKKKLNTQKFEYVKTEVILIYSRHTH